MRKIEFVGACALLGLLSLPLQADAQLLKGQLIGFKSDEGLVTYTPDGSVYNNVMTELEFDADGRFVFDAQLPLPTIDASVDFGGNIFFGVHLVKGQTVEMNITKTDKGYQVDFKGPQTDVSHFVNRATQAFDMMRYWSPDPAEQKTNKEYRDLLDSEYDAVVKLLPTIKDKKTRDYYARLSEGQYKWLKIRLIMDDAYDKKTNYLTDPEFLSLVKDVDVNDDISFRTNLSLPTLSSKVKTAMDGSNEAYCLELMDVVNKYVTYPPLHSQMVRVIGDNYFLYGDGSGDSQLFIDKFLQFAGKDSIAAKEQVSQFLEKKRAMKDTAVGMAAPDITLNTVDGEQIQLSSLLKGKFTYIDVWATWCGPCVKEIPHLEKLVEKYKGNDKVQFISISVDTDVNAWKKKLEKDNPQWVQYILTPENNKIFSDDWGISGIPRFIMIDADGNIFSRDASRPSDEKTVTIIEEQIK